MDSKQVREKISGKLRAFANEARYVLLKDMKELRGLFSDSILALPELEEHFMSKPSGLVGKKECDENFGYTCEPDCTRCHGTGFASRQLTVREALELLKEYVKMFPLPDDERILYVALPSGEKVEVEK